jgi:hypothetical protein
MKRSNIDHNYAPLEKLFNDLSCYAVEGDELYCEMKMSKNTHVDYSMHINNLAVNLRNLAEKLVNTHQETLNPDHISES